MPLLRCPMQVSCQASILEQRVAPVEASAIPRTIVRRGAEVYLPHTVRCSRTWPAAAHAASRAHRDQPFPTTTAPAPNEEATTCVLALRLL
eukprot:2206195-Pyramimonas_sp.AAC.1